MTPETGQKFAYLICFAVISIAVTGYFVGLQSPMNPSAKMWTTESEAGFDGGSRPGSKDLLGDAASAHAGGERAADVIVATRYSDMRRATVTRGVAFRTSLAELKAKPNPLAEVNIGQGQKSFALALRENNRAFRGAPPTVPHSVAQMSVESCLACHGEGFKSETLQISAMSHQFLANCTQCHVEAAPQHMEASLFRENSFVGLASSTEGPRAFQGAPPQIPHSTWMRVNCMSCHGFSGQQGLKTTHPWRQNCQQCHTASSVLDQVQIDSIPKFLPPLKTGGSPNSGAN